MFLEIIGHVSNMAGAVGGIVAAVGVVKMLGLQRRMLEHVEVALKLDDERSWSWVPLPLELTRRDVSRAELLGRLGMLPMRQKGTRFSLRFLSTPEFMRAVNEIVEGKTSRLVIPASREEIEQFCL